MNSLSITVVIFALICFFVDAASAYLHNTVCTQLLLALYLYTLTYLPSMAALILLALLLIVQDLSFFGQAGIQLIYLIPLALASHGLAHIMYPNSVQLILTTMVTGIAQTYLIRSLLLQQHVETCYTVQTVYGIMVSIVVISLIYRLRGKLGNRVRTP